LGRAISDSILWYHRNIKVNPTFLGFLKPSGGVNLTPSGFFLSHKKASGADGTLSRLVSCFQSKNKWRA
jgi:hypothetical protein